MARYQATVPPHRPAAETFAYLATFSNAAEWDPGVLAGEQLDPGPVRPGTRFRLVIPFLGLRMPLTYHVTSYQPDQEVVLAATSDLLHATDKIVVTGGTDGSAVSYDAEVRPRGLLRLLDPLLRRGFHAVADRAAAGLAQALSPDPGARSMASPGDTPPSGGAPSTAGGGAVTGFGTAVDAAMDALIVPGFSRIGLAVRTALLPEFTEGDSPRLDGKTIIITGATSGIGYTAAIALARRGASVHFLARDGGRAERARHGMAAASGAASISYGLADLEDLNSVRAFAQHFRATHDRLDVLIHNAGAIHPEFRVGQAGTELTVAGQVVAPFLLTRLLVPTLLAAAPSRVITVLRRHVLPASRPRQPATARLPLPRRHRLRTGQAGPGNAQPRMGAPVRRTAVAFHPCTPAGWTPPG